MRYFTLRTHSIIFEIIELAIMIKFLIERCANVNAADNNGTTPLHKAVELGNHS